MPLPRWPQDFWSAADRPGAGTGPGIEQGGAVVLLLRRGGGGVAGPADRFPGAGVELVFAAIAAVGGDGGGIAAGLAGGDRFEGRDGDAAGKGGEGFAALLAEGGAVFRVDLLGGAVEQMLEAIDRPLQQCDLGNRSVADTDLGRPVAGFGRGQGGRRQGEGEEESRQSMCAFCEQARDSCGICDLIG